MDVQPGLAARAQRGDEAAFHALYRAVQPGLLRYLRMLVGEDAEDVASETWLQIVKDLDRFRGDDDGFRGWAATIGRHRALDQLRKQRRRPATSAPAEQLAELPSVADTAALALEAVTTEQALALIRTLPQEQAEAVMLRVVLGLDAKAAGKVLGRRPGAVRMAASRGLRRLNELLNEAGTEGDTPPQQRPVTKIRPATLKEVR